MLAVPSPLPSFFYFLFIHALQLHSRDFLSLYTYKRPFFLSIQSKEHLGLSAWFYCGPLESPSPLHYRRIEQHTSLLLAELLTEAQNAIYYGSFEQDSANTHTNKQPHRLSNV